MLREKFARLNLGLVVIVNNAGLDFMAKEGNGLITPNVPVILSLVQEAQVHLGSTLRAIVNVVGQPDVAETLRYGIGLFPKARRVVVVTGSDDSQAQVFEPAIAALRSMLGKLELEDTRSLAYGEMLKRIATLPEDSVVLLGSYFKDAWGKSHLPFEVAAEVGKHANMPVFAVYDS